MTDGGGEIAVLHVDDDEAFAELVAVHLERHFDGARVETCRDGSEAVARLRTEDIDCIVSDFQMPEMNGVELLEAVRKRSDVPFILFTGHGSEEVASDAISAGVSDYVQKKPGDDHGWETRICEADTGGARIEIVSGNELGPSSPSQSNSTNDD